MQGQGVKVIGMLGGAAAGTYSLLTPGNFDTYYPILANYISECVFVRSPRLAEFP
jgi:hypothetical protein